MLGKLIKDFGVEGSVIYTGDANDMRVTYAVPDISVLASTFREPSELIVIELMAIGKPVVGTRIGGTKEQVEDGVTGLLVESNDPKDMAAALERLLKGADLRE